MSLSLLKKNLSWQPETSARRRLRRWTVDMQAVVWIDEQALGCRVHDISPAGARVEPATFRDLSPGARVVLDLPDFPAIPAEVRYGAEGAVGLEFLHDEERETALARYLVARRPQRRDPRKALHVKATLTPCRMRSPCVVKDVSRMGAGVSIGDAHQLSEHDEVMLSIEDYGDVPATVRRISEGEVGLIFHNPLIGILPQGGTG